MHVRRVDELCCVAIRRLDGGNGGFQPTGKERGRGDAGGWQMADSGIDTGESNVVKKYVPVLFLPVGLRGELGHPKLTQS